MPLFVEPSLVTINPAMASIPGGPFVMGSAAMDASYHDATPHWVDLSPYRLGVTAVPERDFRTVTGQAGNKEAPEDHPVVNVSRDAAVEFLRRVQDGNGRRFGLPTEAEQENGIRGPAVNLRDVIRSETVGVGDFADFVRDRFENMVTEIKMGARIFTDPTDEELRRILEGDQPLYAWRVFGTDSGRMPTSEEVWFNQSGTAPADFGPANGYGLKGTVGGVWEWSGDRYGKGYYKNPPDKDHKDPMGPEKGGTFVLRGGSWGDLLPDYLRAACRRNYGPGGFYGFLGFRLAASAQD